MISSIPKHGYLFTDRRIGKPLKIGEHICVEPLEIKGEGENREVKLSVDSGSIKFIERRKKYEKIIFTHPVTGFDLVEISVSNIQANGRIYFRVLAPKDMDINREKEALKAE